MTRWNVKTELRTEAISKISTQKQEQSTPPGEVKHPGLQESDYFIYEFHNENLVHSLSVLPVVLLSSL